jgi:hypothetical protein
MTKAMTKLKIYSLRPNSIKNYIDILLLSYSDGRKSDFIAGSKLKYYFTPVQEKASLQNLMNSYQVRQSRGEASEHHFA